MKNKSIEDDIKNMEESVKSKLSELLEYHSIEFLELIIKDIRISMVDKNEDEITFETIKKINSLKKSGVNSKYKTKKKTNGLNENEQENLKKQRIKLNTLYEASKSTVSLKSITTGMRD